MLKFKELIVLANLSDLLFYAENRPGIKRKRKTICGCYGSICLRVPLKQSGHVREN